MKIKNVSNSIVVVHDLFDNGVNLILRPDEEKLLYNEDTEKSSALKQYITDEIIEIISDAEPEDGVGEHFEFLSDRVVVINDVSTGSQFSP